MNKSVSEQKEDSKSQNEFNPNERLAGLKAEANENELDCKIENIHVLPVIKKQCENTEYISFHQLNSNNNSGYFRFKILFYPEISVPSREDNLFIEYKHKGILISDLYEAFSFTNSVFGDTVELDYYRTHIKFLTEQISFVHSRTHHDFKEDISEVRNKTYSNDDFIDINTFLKKGLYSLEKYHSEEFINNSISNDNLTAVDDFQQNYNTFVEKVQDKILQSRYLRECMKCRVKDYYMSDDSDRITLIVENNNLEINTLKEFTVDFPKTWENSNKLVELVQDIGEGLLDGIKDEHVYLYPSTHNKKGPVKIKSDDNRW